MNKRFPVLLRALTVKPDPVLACALLVLSQETGQSPQALFKAKVAEALKLRPLIKPVATDVEDKLRTMVGFVAANSEAVKKLYLTASRTQTHPRAEEIEKMLVNSLKTRAMIETLLAEILVDSLTLADLDRVYTAVEQSMAKEGADDVMIKLKRNEAAALLRLLTKVALNR